MWVLAGQSNMEGAGWLAGALEPDSRVWALSSAGAWDVARDPLHRFWESFTPVHQDLLRAGLTEADKQVSDEEWARRERQTRKQGAGLGIAFGKAMAGATGRPIGLIAAAHGGTSLDQWSPKLKYRGGHSLYGAMLERIQRAGGNLRGILWYQGESDTLTIDLARSYAQRFDDWIAAARADTGLPDLAVIAVQIGRVIEPPDRQGLWMGWELVREALRTLPLRVPHTAVSTAVDLPLVDLIHVNTEGLIRLGRRMARLALAGQQRGPQVKSIERFTSPAGLCNAIRVRFEGVTGHWCCANNIRGFEVRVSEPQARMPLYVVNAWVDMASGTDVIVLLNRELDADTQLGYGLGLNPVCELADEDDTPLCAFLPVPVT